MCIRDSLFVEDLKDKRTDNEERLKEKAAMRLELARILEVADRIAKEEWEEEARQKVDEALGALQKTLNRAMTITSRLQESCTLATIYGIKTATTDALFQRTLLGNISKMTTATFNAMKGICTVPNLKRWAAATAGMKLVVTGRWGSVLLMGVWYMGPDNISQYASGLLSKLAEYAKNYPMMTRLLEQLGSFTVRKTEVLLPLFVTMVSASMWSYMSNNPIRSFVASMVVREAGKVQARNWTAWFYNLVYNDLAKMPGSAVYSVLRSMFDQTQGVLRAGVGAATAITVEPLKALINAVAAATGIPWNLIVLSIFVALAYLGYGFTKTESAKEVIEKATQLRKRAFEGNGGGSGKQARVGDGDDGDDGDDDDDTGESVPMSDVNAVDASLHRSIVESMEVRCFPGDGVPLSAPFTEQSQSWHRKDFFMVVVTGVSASRLLLAQA